MEVSYQFWALQFGLSSSCHFGFCVHVKTWLYLLAALYRPFSKFWYLWWDLEIMAISRKERRDRVKTRILKVLAFIMENLNLMEFHFQPFLQYLFWPLSGLGFVFLSCFIYPLLIFTSLANYIDSWRYEPQANREKNESQTYQNK